MKEKLLHYIWRTRNFDHKNLKTTHGKAIDIIYPGVLNMDQGPDFSQAKLKIDSTLWVGNVEIHINSSDWIRHQHQHDPKYHNVILHVVYDNDIQISGPQSSHLPCLQLKERINKNLITSYERLMSQQKWIPCADQIYGINPQEINIWLESLLVKRLERKTQQIHTALESTTFDWEEIFYQFIAGHLGMKTNKDAFLQLTRTLPRSILSKHRDSLFELEALLFGHSGLLSEKLKDDYPNRLWSEYKFLQKVYGLDPMSSNYWNYLRLRPANFPTVRIAQLARLIHHTDHLFSKCLAASNKKEIYNLFDLEVSQYWRYHVVFDKKSKIARNRKLGFSTIDNIIINTIVPFMFLYGKVKNESTIQNKAFALLEQLKPENNSIINRWKQLGLTSTDAFQSQALIELKNEYCDHKKCLDCRMGHEILKTIKE